MVSMQSGLMLLLPWLSFVPLPQSSQCTTVDYQRGGLDYQEAQDMRNFVKRLKKAELHKVNQRFQPMLQAADVSYEVQLPWT